MEYAIQLNASKIENLKKKLIYNFSSKEYNEIILPDNLLTEE